MDGALSPADLRPADVSPEVYQHEVTCYCGSSRVVSRMPRWYDQYVVCSRGCFDDMSAETDYYSRMFGGQYNR